MPLREARRGQALALGLASVLLTFGPGCATAAPTRTVRGVVIDVDGASLQRFNSFTVRTDAGEVLQFKPAPEFYQASAHVMSPGHVREHMALAVPVQVTYRRADDGTLLALAASDG